MCDDPSGVGDGDGDSVDEDEMGSDEMS